jgi:uridylate kinase, putative
MRVVVSIGGSVLAPGLDSDRIAAYASAVGSLTAEECQVGVVVGGGSVAREYIGTARELGANEVLLDQLGIGVTRLNARLLITALDEQATLTPPEDYETAGQAFRRGEVPIMGGVSPGQTTDAVAVALAESIGADLLVFATSADGVYSADPETDADAEQFETLSPQELVDIVVPMGRDAGASAPVDLLAAKLIDRAELRTIVLDGSDPERILSATLHGTHEGTDIVPVGSDRPDLWGEQ